MNIKQIVGEQAIKYVKDGMTVGLGSGTTAYYMIVALSKKIQSGLNIKAVATSKQTEQLAKELKIPLVDLTVNTTIDVTIDGADEIDLNLNLIKGGGGAHLREKLIALNSKKVIIIADDSKLTDSLYGASLPVEIIPFGYERTISQLMQYSDHVILRMEGETPYVTDNGNYIVDCEIQSLPLDDLNRSLKLMTGVVETGLFLKLADSVMIVNEKGEVTEKTQ